MRDIKINVYESMGLSTGGMSRILLDTEHTGAQLFHQMTAQ